MQSLELSPHTVDLARVARELDLESRLQQIPATAQTRGIHFLSLREAAKRRNVFGFRELDRILDRPRRSYGLYPVSELVEATAVAGALVNPIDPREGMRNIWRDNPAYATQTWYGRVFAKYLAPNPVTALRWLEISHDYIENYGTWRLEVRGPRCAVMHHLDEYFWLDALRGACEGLLVLCGANGRVEMECDSPFAGRFQIEW